MKCRVNGIMQCGVHPRLRAQCKYLPFHFSRARWAKYASHLHHNARCTGETTFRPGHKWSGKIRSLHLNPGEMEFFPLIWWEMLPGAVLSITYWDHRLCCAYTLILCKFFKEHDKKKEGAFHSVSLPPGFPTLAICTVYEVIFFFILLYGFRQQQMAPSFAWGFIKLLICLKVPMQMCSMDM